MVHAGSYTGRVRARRCVVQALYQWIIAGASPASIVQEFVADRELIRVDMDYFTELTQEIPPRFEELTATIEPEIDRTWLQIDTVEQAILLIGTYELLFCPHIPWLVVMNEAVELCKMFGAEDGHRYINGVLDKIAHNVRGEETAGSPVANR